MLQCGCGCFALDFTGGKTRGPYLFFMTPGAVLCADSHGAVYTAVQPCVSVAYSKIVLSTVCNHNRILVRPGGNSTDMPCAMRSESVVPWDLWFPLHTSPIAQYRGWFDDSLLQSPRNGEHTAWSGFLTGLCGNG